MTKKDYLDLANICLRILKNKGKKGKGPLPRAMAAFQVLQAIEEDHSAKFQLIVRFGRPGSGGGTNSSSHIVSRALMRLERCGLVVFNYVTTDGLYFVVKGKVVEPSYEVLAFYQLTNRGMEADHIELGFTPNGHDSVQVMDEKGNIIQSYAHTEDRDEG